MYVGLADAMIRRTASDALVMAGRIKRHSCSNKGIAALTPTRRLAMVGAQGTGRIARRRDINPGERAHEDKVDKANEADESQGWMVAQQRPRLHNQTTSRLGHM